MVIQASLEDMLVLVAQEVAVLATTPPVWRPVALAVLAIFQEMLEEMDLVAVEAEVVLKRQGADLKDLRTGMEEMVEIGHFIILSIRSKDSQLCQLLLGRALRAILQEVKLELTEAEVVEEDWNTTPRRMPLEDLVAELVLVEEAARMARKVAIPVMVVQVALAMQIFLFFLLILLMLVCLEAKAAEEVVVVLPVVVVAARRLELTH